MLATLCAGQKRLAMVEIRCLGLEGLFEIVPKRLSDDRDFSLGLDYDFPWRN
jgi:hypothetical protein